MTTETFSDAPTSKQLAFAAIDVCEDHKAEDIRLYDVQNTSLLADYYLICTGKSDPHIRAVRDHLRGELSDLGATATRVEGVPASRWMVMDYGILLVHIFNPETRQYYLLEELWTDAKAVYPPEEGVDTIAEN